ncbi:hypothetical protein [Enterococcus rivorum]|uniref:hypothetical protein n=1 Tax=Enterococcus rivorum TaxID=762845 RepID=UPI00363B6379
MTYTTMISYGVFVESGSDIRSTKVGSKVIIGGVQYEFIEKKVDKEKRTAVFTLANPEPSLNDLSKELVPTVEFFNAENVKVKMEVITGDKGYYTLYMSSLPEKWEAFRVSLQFAKEEKSGGQVIVASKKEQNVKVVKPSKQLVLLNSFEYQISKKKKLIQANNKEVRKNEQSIEVNNKNIQQYEDEKEFQTEEEVVQTNIAIEQVKAANITNEGNIQRIKSENQEIEKQISKIQERIEKETTE